MSRIGLARSWRTFAGLGAAIAALGLAAVLAVALLTPERHLDGRGPLASTGDPGSKIVEAFDQGTIGPWTVGLELCAATGDGPVTVESVSPTRTVGSGYRFLGAEIRQFEPAPGHDPIGSILGFPPAVPDPMHPAEGYKVTTTCSEHFVRYTELLLGFGVQGADGGGWLGSTSAMSRGVATERCSLATISSSAGRQFRTRPCATGRAHLRDEVQSPTINEGTNRSRSRLTTTQGSGSRSASAKAAHATTPVLAIAAVVRLAASAGPKSGS